MTDKLKQTWVLQAIRSAAQWIAGYVTSLVVVATAVNALGVDPETVEGTIRTAVELVTFILYIVTVRFLENKVDPRFGWLNGWKTDITYEVEHG